jgi:hypothetical protein
MAKHPIDKIFHKKLKDYEKTPSKGAWEMLSQQLDNQESKKGFSVWLSVAASFLVLLMSFGVWFFYSNNDNSLQYQSQSKIKAQKELNKQKPKMEEQYVRRQDMTSEKVFSQENQQVSINPQKDKPLMVKDSQKTLENHSENKKTIQAGEDKVLTPPIETQVAKQESKQDKTVDEPLKIKVTVKLASQKPQIDAEMKTQIAENDDKPKKNKLSKRIQMIKKGEAKANIFTILGVDRDKLTVSLSKD